MRRGILACCLLASWLPASEAIASVQIELPGILEGWLPTSVVLAPGDSLRITATGCIGFGNPGVDETNPDGAYCWDTSQWPDLPTPPPWTCMSALQLSLVAKIGNGPCFTVGSSFSAVVSDAGQLSLAYNDRPGGFSDNFGSFSIVVSGSFAGACCFANGACMQGRIADCESLGGSYMGDGVPCFPDPCGSIPVEVRSWGRVKALYR